MSDAGGGGEKTEQATPKKLEDLRKKGMAARSIELPAGFSLLVLVLVLPVMLRNVWQSLETSLAVVLSSADTMDLQRAGEVGGAIVLDASRALAPGIALVLVATLASGMLLTKERPNPHALKPQWNRLSPKQVLKQKFSWHTPVELLKAVAKLSLLALVTAECWRTGYAELLAAGPGPEGLRQITGDSTYDMMWRVAVLSLLVGIGDAWFQRHSFGKQSRMSLQEVKDEYKQSEGDPHTKGQRRSLMLAASRSRMIQAVPKADVVLANPTHLVVALRYEPGTNAPVVVARGAGVVADRIKAVAREHGVPVLADKPLARALYRATEVGDTIPAELFRAVAEVLAVVYAAKRRGAAPHWNRESVLT